MEESVYLEFKSAASLENTDRNKIEISKDVSAFANSDGGLLIYGIKEKDHKADSYDFIDGRKVTKEWIENVIDSNIKRIIPKLRIFPIRFDSDLEKSVFIIKIPASRMSPHMSSENRYYRRANYKVIPMEEYEIRNLYNRRLGTKLSIDKIIVNPNGASSTGNKLRSVTYLFLVQIRNDGTSIEKDYKVEIHLPEIVYQNNRYMNPLERCFIRKENGFLIFSIPNTSPIFQDEVTTIISFSLSITKSNLVPLMENGIKLKLYYTSGIEEYIDKVSERFEYNGRLRIEDFE
jgi:hypothetical protein